MQSDIFLEEKYEFLVKDYFEQYVLFKKKLKAALLAASILSAFMPAVSFSQTAAPTQLNVDKNGVDLVQGNFTLVQTDVSIGPTGPTMLAYTRLYGKTGWSTNIAVKFYSTIENGQTYFYVQHGLIADRFLQSGTSYTSTTQNGSTLTFTGGQYIFDSSDGTEIAAILDTPEPGNKLTRISYVKYPTGIRHNYSYNVQSVIVPPCTSKPCNYRTYQRLSSVTNSIGYQLKLGYVSDSPLYSSIVAWQTLSSVTAINNSIDYCAPSANACTGLTVNWPKSSYTQAVSGSNMVWTITDPNGGSTRLTLANTSIQSDPIAIKRPGSTSDTVTIARNPTSGLVSTLVNEGQTWTYNFVDSGDTRTATITDPSSATRQAVSSISLGRLTSFRDALNRTTSYQYDGAGRATRITLPEGNYTSIGYDGRGNVISTTSVSKTPGTPSNITSTSGYDSVCTNITTCNQPNWTKDAAGNQTDYTYDPTHGGVLTVTSPAAVTNGVRPQTRYTYATEQAYFKNSAGSIVASSQPIYLPTAISTCQTTASCAGTADEIKTTIDYGPQVAGTGNNLLPVVMTSGSGALTATKTMTYDPVGNLTYVDGPLAGTADTTRALYDAARQTIGVIGPDPDGAGPLKNRASRLTYNLDGQVTLVEQGTTAGQSDANWSAFAPLQTVTSVYDANAQKTSDTISGGGTVYGVRQYSYDTLGRLDCAAMRMNSATWGTLPASACTLQAAGSFGPDRITKTIYDAADEVTNVQTAYGTADQSDEVTNTYTNNGKQATIADGLGNLTTYVYDGLDRLSQTRYPTAGNGAVSSTTDYEGLTYDPNGNVTQRRLRDGNVIGLTYDALNRLTLKTMAHLTTDDQDITYSYDLLGRLTKAAKNAQNQTSLTWDALGRKTGESNYYYAMTFQSDAAGRRTRATWSDGFYVNYDYLTTGQVSAIRENGATSGVGVLGTYAYDDLGRRTSLTRGNGVVTSYGYDPVSRLATLTHDLAGTAQDVTTSFTYNPASQIASSTRSNDIYAWGGHYNVDRPYTINGLNQLTMAGTTALGYDGRGNLTTSGTSSYGYTSQNRLATAPNGIVLNADSLERLDFTATGVLLAHDGDDMIAEYGYNGSVGPIQRRYVYGPGEDEPLVWYEGSGTTDRRWLVADERGSVVAVTNASGTATAINSYDEYGIPAATNVGRFQYTGQAWIPEVGLAYYKARFYSPTLGRFMQTDPIGYGDGMNWYNYVGSDPVNGRDPGGLADGAIVVTARREFNNFGSSGNLSFSFPSFDFSNSFVFSGGGGRGDGGGADQIVVTGTRPKPAPPLPPLVINIPVDLGSPPSFGPGLGSGAPTLQNNKNCTQASSATQRNFENITGWLATRADELATVSAVTGMEEIAGPAEAASWLLSGAKSLSQYSRGDTAGAGATFASQAAGSLVGKFNKLIPIGPASQKAFNSGVSSALGTATGKALDALVKCE